MLLLLSACTDKRVSQLTIGIKQDSLLKIISEGAPPGDATPNVLRHNNYLVNGKMYDIYLFDPENREPKDSATVEESDLTPIIVVDGVVQGWGWRQADQLAQETKIAIRQKK